MPKPCPIHNEIVPITADMLLPEEVGKRPCYKAHPEPVPATCRMCFLEVNQPGYWDRFGMDPPTPPTPPEPSNPPGPSVPPVAPPPPSPPAQKDVSSPPAQPSEEAPKASDPAQTPAQEPQQVEGSSRRLSWAYGVTTVPSRYTMLLPSTLRSLHDGGFDKPWLFADGEDRGLAAQTGLKVIARGAGGVGAFTNWYLALKELVSEHPQADRYAIFQDDVLTYYSLREYLESCPYPQKGYLNLMTLRPNRQQPPPAEDYIGWYLSNQMGRSACGLVFDQDAAQTILASPVPEAHRQNPTDGHRRIDGVVSDILCGSGFQEWIHSPSLLLHTGLQSSLKPPKTHQLQAYNFKGPSFDAMIFLEGAEVVNALTAASSPATGGLGDMVEKALTSVGITKDRVEKLLGRPCNCKERQRRLNELSHWARRVVGGKLSGAMDYFNRIFDR